MQFFATERKWSFEAAARLASAISLFGSAVTILIIALSPERGIQFITNMLLILIFFIQVVVFLVFIGVAIVLAGFRGGLRISPSVAVLSLVAMTALLAQFMAMQRVPVVGGSIP
jgi:hypothetical protein